MDSYEAFRKALLSQKRDEAKFLIRNGAILNRKKGGRHTSRTPLHLAIFFKDIEIVRMLLERNADVNVDDNEGLTPLHVAARDGFLLGVEILLKFLAYIDSKGNCGLTPLCVAVKKGHLRIVEYLITRGASVNSSCTIVEKKDGYTALHIAVLNGFEEITQLLLSKGSDANALTKNKLTALHMAGQTNRYNLVKILFNAGADINAKSKDNKTPLSLALEHHHSRVVDELLKCGPDINDKVNRAALGYAIKYCKQTVTENLVKYGFEVNPEEVYDSELLFKSVEKGYKKTVEDLIGLGADVNSVDKEGEPLLACAVNYRRHEIATLLINYGCDINARIRWENTPIINSAIEAVNQAGLKAIIKCQYDVIKTLIFKMANVRVYDDFKSTPLHCCASTDREDIEEIAHLLIKEGAEVNIRDCEERTPLHIAAKTGNDKLVQLLLEHKADIEARDEKGATPLIVAAECSKEGAAKILLEDGADITATDKKGLNALYAAVKKSDERIVELILKYADVNARDNNQLSIYTASEMGNGENFKSILKRKLDLDIKYKDGLTLLHLSDCPIIADLLLKYGADVNARDDNNRTPIFTAVLNMWVNITKIILNEGVDVSAKDNDGLTALHVLVQEMEYDSDGDVEEEKTLRVLLEGNADPNSRCNKGMTPLHICARNGSRKVLEILLGFGADLNLISNDGRTLFDYVNGSGFRTGVDYYIKKHIVMLKTAKLYVSESNLQILDTEFEAEFKLEYKEVKYLESKIENSNVSFHDILSKDKNKLATYFNNESILQFLNSFNF